MSDTTKQYLYTKVGKILVINKNLDITTEVDNDQLYIYYLKDNDCRFIAKKDETLVLNKENNVIARLAISKKTKKIGSKIYSVLANSILEIDLNDISK